MAERNQRTVRDLRRGNRSALLRHLYFEGPLSRQELGRDTGLSAGSISNVVGELIAEGLVEEAGAVDSDGGRPRTLLQVAADHGRVVGVDIGETRVRVELFDLDLAELARHRAPAVRRRSRRGPRGAVGAGRPGRPSCETTGTDPALVLGVGVGVPGIVEQGTAGDLAVVHGQTIGWDAVPVGRLLRAGDRPAAATSTTAPRRWARPRCGSAAGAARATPSSR